jgi:predicted RNA-binding protein with PIN domain
MAEIRRFAGEVAIAFAVMGGFVALALGGAALESVTARHYPRAAVADRGEAEAPTTWLVDGFNLLHAVVLHGGPRNEWWREANRARVVELAARFDDARAEVVVVFDGARPDAEPAADRASPPRPRVVFAASADEWMLAALRAAPDPGRIAVVTADRQLSDRARYRGARVVRPTEFAARCRSD